MKTFFLLITVAFLTIQVQAQINQEEMLTQEEPMAENQSPELQSMETEGSNTVALDPQERKIVCFCRFLCRRRERHSGTCQFGGVRSLLCCR